MNDEPAAGYIEWSFAIGKFMIAFGNIESSINELMSNVCSIATQRFVAQLPLGQRIKFMREHMTDWKALTDENRATINAHLKFIEELANTRNLIAHNPLQLKYFAVGERRFRKLHIESRTGARIDFDALVKFAEAAHELSRVLTGNWMDYDMWVMDPKDRVQPKLELADIVIPQAGKTKLKGVTRLVIPRLTPL